EENGICDAASVDRGTAQRGELRQGAQAVEPVDVVRFERRVGRKIEPVFHRNERDGTRLLVALKYGLDLTEIASGTHDAALVAIVAGQDPETVFPGVVDDVVHMADRAFWEGVGDAPGRAGVGRCVDVNFL